jgi:GT2 family glycosyltransferase
MTRVSVIIPTVGRSHLRAVLAALEDQCDRAAGPPEVIISFDAAQPPGQAALRARDPGRMALRVLTVTAGTGVSGARNRGAAAASGDLLLFLDEDVIPRPGWLSAMRAAPWCGGLVLGRISSNWSRRPIDQLRFLRYEQRHRLNSLGRDEATDPMPCGGPWLSYVSGGNFGITGDLFGELGGFDPAIAVGQDRDLAARAISDGAHIHYVADAVGQHINEGSWASLVRGRFRSGMTCGRSGAVRASPDRTFARYEWWRQAPRALLAVYASDLSYEMGRFAAQRQQKKNTRTGRGRAR